MPDISMCSNKKCPSRLKCYRFMAIPNPWQSYAAFEPKKGRVKCLHFWKLEK